MKKIYNAPEMVIVAIATQEMIATSLESMGVNGGDVTLVSEQAEGGTASWSRDNDWDE